LSRAHGFKKGGEAMRTVHVEIKVELVLKVDEGTEIGEVVNALEYGFSDQTGHANVEDSEILDYEVRNSR
jgi:hypothetical protein